MTMRNSITTALVPPSSLPVTGVNGSVTLEFCFPADDPVFAGHFPSRSVVPGAFQLEMVHVGAESVLQRRLAVIEIGRAKFLRPIAPAELVRMELKLTNKDTGWEARASFSVYGQTAGEAVLLLRIANEKMA